MVEDRDTIIGHSKSIPKKKFIIIIVSIACVIVAALVGIGIWYATWTAPALTNLDKVAVLDCLNSNQSITIPIKVKKVYPNHYYQKFDSDLSFEQLCEKASEYDPNVKYQIKDNFAYLFKENNGKIVARAVLHNKTRETNFSYILDNMSVEGIVFPKHLVHRFIDEQITLNGTQYTSYAVAFISIDEFSDWLNNIGIYTLEINNQKDKIICNYTKSGYTQKTEIYFNGNLIAIREIPETKN